MEYFPQKQKHKNHKKMVLQFAAVCHPGRLALLAFITNKCVLVIP
jgi:hypothetical protein